jgi:hypothetical protein
MKATLHITSGDVAGDLLKKSGVPGEVFVWHDILYDGPRRPGWPDDAALEVRADFIEAETGGGLDRGAILRALKSQYEKLSGASRYDRLVLWFDAAENGCEKPLAIYTYAAAHDAPPQFWGDTTLWSKINRLSLRQPPRLRIEGPPRLLPQRQPGPDMNRFTIHRQD